MDSKQFKKIGRLLKEIYKELESEALKTGVDIFGNQFTEAKNMARLALLKKFGFSLEQYVAAKELVAPAKKIDVKAELDKVHQRIDNIPPPVEIPPIPTTEDIQKIAEAVVKPPVITNQIVKETTIEKPTIVKETKVEQITNNVPYDETALKTKIEDLNKRIDEIPNVPPPDLEKFKESLITEWQTTLKESINILNMPDFRKLAMGLDGRISTLETTPSGGVTSVTASSPLSSSGGTTPDISLGTVPISKGGTNATSQVPNQIIYYDGTSLTSNTLFALDPVISKALIIQDGILNINNELGVPLDITFTNDGDDNTGINHPSDDHLNMVVGGGTVLGMTISNVNLPLLTASKPVFTDSSKNLVSVTSVPIANGGTNNTSAYTAGSVIFSNGTSLTQDNSNFFWDSTNTRLGIGLSAPASLVDIYQSRTAVLTANKFVMNLVGAYNPVSTDSGAFAYYGLQFGLTKNGSHDKTNGALIGLLGSVELQDSSNIYQAFGIVPYISNAGSGTLTDGRAIYIKSPGASGTITTAYGAYIDPQTRSGVGTAYGLYQSGASDANYFQGVTHIGLSALDLASVTSSKLEVHGLPGVIIGKNIGTGSATGDSPTTRTFATSYLHIGGQEYNGSASVSSPSYQLISFGFRYSSLTNYPAAIGYGEVSDLGNTKGELMFFTRDVTTDTAPSERVRISTAGKMGIGTNSPSAYLHALGTTEQLRLGYDASNYLSTTVSSTGGVTFDAVGSGSAFTFSDKISINNPINLKNYTVATLPSGVRGDVAYVTDALAPAFLTAVVGGGTIVTPVFYDGANWVAY